MTTYDWHTTYTNAVEAFAGATPGPELEQLLLETFQHSPQTVTNAIAKAANAFKTGNIHSPWGIVRKELTRISEQPHINVTDTRSKDKQLAKAEAWIKHSGLHLNEDEIIDHLFAPPRHTADLNYLENLELTTRKRPGRSLYDGLLKASIIRTREHGTQPIPNTGGTLTDQDTPALRQRLLTIWQEQQPRARQIEADLLHDAEQWKAQHKPKPAAPTPPTEDDLPF
jgi:hypothetical protein